MATIIEKKLKPREGDSVQSDTSANYKDVTDLIGDDLQKQLGVEKDPSKQGDIILDAVKRMAEHKFPRNCVLHLLSGLAESFDEKVHRIDCLVHGKTPPELNVVREEKKGEQKIKETNQTIEELERQRLEPLKHKAKMELPKATAEAEWNHAKKRVAGLEEEVKQLQKRLDAHEKAHAAKSLSEMDRLEGDEYKAIREEREGFGKKRGASKEFRTWNQKEIDQLRATLQDKRMRKEAHSKLCEKAQDAYKGAEQDLKFAAKGVEFIDEQLKADRWKRRNLKEQQGKFKSEHIQTVNFCNAVAAQIKPLENDPRISWILR